MSGGVCTSDLSRITLVGVKRVREKTLWLSHCELKEYKRSGSSRRKLSVPCPCAFRALWTHSSEPIAGVTICALADFLGNLESKLRLLSITYRYICHLFYHLFFFLCNSTCAYTVFTTRPVGEGRRRWRALLTTSWQNF